MSLHYLTPLLAPSSVLVIGDTGSAGSAASVLSNLRAGDFKGRIQTITSRAPAGRRDFNAGSIPEGVDLALIAAPAKKRAAIIAACAERGVRAAVLLPERETAGVVPGAPAIPPRLRVLGPGSHGVVRPALGLNASLVAGVARKGNIALVSRSGSIVAAALDWAAGHGVGFSSVVSLGAGPDVDIGDVLDFLAVDRETESILIYLESVRNVRKFMSALRACSRVKPVILLKARRYGEGGRTGPDAAHDHVFDAAVRRAGALRVRFLLQLFDAARTLMSPFRPVDNRLAIITNGGGPGILAADTTVDAGVSLACVTPQTAARLAETFAHAAANPYDLGAAAGPAQYRAALDILLADPGVDGALAVLAPQGAATDEGSTAIASAIVACARLSPKPVIACVMGEATVSGARAVLGANRIPGFATPETAVGAFSYLAAHYRHRQMLLQAPAPLSDRTRADIATARRVIADALAEDRLELSESESQRMLAAFNVPVATTRLVNALDDAVGAANAIGYPVAMKVHGAGIAHKANSGGVVLNLTDDAAVAAGWYSIRDAAAHHAPEWRVDGIVVQAMCRSANGRELVVGVRQDPAFGPVITCKAGGMFGPAAAREAIALPPLNAFLARDLVTQTRIAPMLGAYQGMPAIDFAALDSLLLRVSEMVCELPSIAGIEIDPVFADDTGVIVLDARIHLMPAAAAQRKPYAHMAIHPYPAGLEEQWRTRGDAGVTIRPIRPEDAEIEQAFVRGLSAQTKFYRFLDVLNELSPEMLARFTQIDYDREMALIAVHFDGGADGKTRETQIGVARYVTNPDGSSCEFAVVIADGWRRHGLGVKLMEKLMACARGAGLTMMEGDVLADNHAMLAMMHRLGFHQRISPDDPTLRLVSREL